MDAEKLVYENLQKFGLDSDVKPTTLKQLVKITEVLDSTTSSQKTAIQQLKASKISINKVSQDTGIARQTFYNNPILAAYIEKYAEANGVESPYEVIDALRSELRRRDEQITGLVQRDATAEYYKAQAQALTDEVASLQETIKSQEELIRRLKANGLHIV